jgi:hypothetical protein
MIWKDCRKRGIRDFLNAELKALHATEVLHHTYVARMRQGRVERGFSEMGATGSFPFFHCHSRAEAVSQFPFLSFRPRIQRGRNLNLRGY